MLEMLKAKHSIENSYKRKESSEFIVELINCHTPARQVDENILFFNLHCFFEENRDFLNNKFV